jgi:hypothetical protein
MHKKKTKRYRMETVFRIFEAGLKEDEQIVSPSQLELTRQIAYQLYRSVRILPSMSYVSGSILLEFPALSVAVSEDVTTIIPLSATGSCTYFQNNTALQEDTRELEKAFLLCFHMATEASHGYMVGATKKVETIARPRDR